jgi:phosphoribosyl 1,2-cyclic phosphodiesterase
MSLYICSLNSGSNGNCYYIGNEKEAVLIDAGISCRETEKRMLRAGLDIRSVKAIFISHEHSDHIRGVEVLSRKHNLPVYITPSTKSYGNLQLQEHLNFTFDAGRPQQVGDLRITGFRKAHDASDPHSFIVEHLDTTVGVFTDIGSSCRHVITHFSRCHAVFLESNYDEEMLRNGSYPIYLKRRISGGQGHLSNTQALQLLLTYRRQDLSHVLLSHLSAENNCPSLVEELFTRHAPETNITVASRHEESAVFFISGSGSTLPLAPAGAAAQMSLFE